MQVKLILMAVLGLPILFSYGSTSTQKSDELINADSKSELRGSFKGYGSEKVSGKASIFLTNNQYRLKLENFNTTAGPDLKVYLSKSTFPLEFISLGSLKSTNGNQVYDIIGAPDFSQLRFVLIHCERYNHLYGSAELMQ